MRSCGLKLRLKVPTKQKLNFQNQRLSVIILQDRVVRTFPSNDSDGLFDSVNNVFIGIRID